MARLWKGFDSTGAEEAVQKMEVCSLPLGTRIVRDVLISGGVAPFARGFGFPWEMVLINMTTENMSFAEKARLVYPDVKYPIARLATSGIGKAVANGALQKPAFAVWPLFFDLEHDRRWSNRIMTGVCSGIAQSLATFNNKAYTLVKQGGVTPLSMTVIYSPSFLQAVAPRYFGYMCIANSVTIEFFYMAKDYFKHYYPHWDDLRHTVAASATGLLPAAAVLTLPERNTNMQFQKNLLLLFPQMVNQPGVKLTLRLYLAAACVRIMWKGIENGIALGGSSWLRNRLFPVVSVADNSATAPAIQRQSPNMGS